MHNKSYFNFKILTSRSDKTLLIKRKILRLKILMKLLSPLSVFHCSAFSKIYLRLQVSYFDTVEGVWGGGVVKYNIILQVHIYVAFKVCICALDN